MWDDDRIRSLLASISLGYPIGAVMMLRAGGIVSASSSVPSRGAPTPVQRDAERLILDGQRRLTSLFQSRRLDGPVLTRDQRGREIERWYYVDMQRALDPNGDREEAVVALPADRPRAPRDRCRYPCVLLGPASPSRPRPHRTRGRGSWRAGRMLCRTARSDGPARLASSPTPRTRSATGGMWPSFAPRLWLCG